MRQPGCGGRRWLPREESLDAPSPDAPSLDAPPPDRSIARGGGSGGSPDHHAAGLEPGGRAVDDPAAGTLGSAGHAANRRRLGAAGPDRAAGGGEAAAPPGFDRARGLRALALAATLATTVLAATVLAATVLAATVLAATGARAETTLRLSETATVAVPPDQVAATLRAEAIAATPADAQQRVNAAMADTLDRAHAANGVDIESGGYTVWRIGPTPQDRAERWQAGQSVTLRGHDGAAVLKLVGELQQRGLGVVQLGWELSEEATRAARQKALAEAVRALRGRADDAAALLDLQFESFREVRLDVPRPMPPARMAMPMAAAAAVPAGPAIEASDIRISATAEAEVALKPR